MAKWTEVTFKTKQMLVRPQIQQSPLIDLHVYRICKRTDCLTVVCFCPQIVVKLHMN